KVFDATTMILLRVLVGWQEKLMPFSFASSTNVKTVIVEGELELERDFHAEENDYRLPIVRVWSMDRKCFGYLDVDAIAEHHYDTAAKDRIVLSAPMRRVLDAVFASPSAVFGDLFKNRHGGIVIMAAGSPGVGKTLTAEVYAEFTKRPLYPLEM